MEPEGMHGLYFSCHIKTEGLLWVTVSDLHSKSGNILETVQDRYVVTTNH